jgi:hypothetical protein
MKKTISLFVTTLIVIIGLLTSNNFVLAAQEPQKLTLEPTDCFEEGLYQFQSVEVGVGPTQVKYKAGEIIDFSGKLKNKNPYPVVDGNVFVRISKVNPNFATEGHNAIDEFIALENVSIDSESEIQAEFNWQVPSNLGAGDYQADYFFSVGKKFNLGGLPFTNEIIVGFSRFEVISDQQTDFVLDRSKTLVNGEKYQHTNNWPFIKQGEKAEIFQPLKNLSAQGVEVDVTYDLYYWDSLDENDFISSKSEKVSISANSSINLNYMIDNVSEAAYYLKITATKDDVSSIVNLRITSDVTKARINYPAITKFPINKGETFKVFSCLHTVFGEEENAKLILTLTDDDGEEVAKGEWSGLVGSFMQAVSSEITIPDEYGFLTLKAELFDTSGALVEEYETNYDCSTLDSESCRTLNENRMKEIVLIVSIIVILLALVLLFISKKLNKGNGGLDQKNSLKRILVVLATILIIIGLIAILSAFTGLNKIKLFAVNFTYAVPSQTSSPQSSDYLLGPRIITRGSVSRTVNITFNQHASGSTRQIGDVLTFSIDAPCAFNSSGGAWDTPVCGDVQEFTDGSYRKAKIQWSMPDPTASAISSDPSVISCSGLSCTVVGVGSATITIAVNATNATFNACAESDYGLNTYGGSDVLGCKIHRPGVISDNIRLSVQSGGASSKPLAGDAGTQLPIPGYSAIWNFTVSPIYPSCGPAEGVPSATMPTSNLCSVGDVGDSFGEDGTNRWIWGCVGANTGWIDDTAWCFAPKTVYPSCGPAEGVPSATMPTSNLCSVGDVGDSFGEDGTNRWFWGCVGANTGWIDDTAWCFAPNDGGSPVGGDPVDGGWSNPTCPTHCDYLGGIIYRTCNNPTPANGGADCSGDPYIICPPGPACQTYNEDLDCIWSQVASSTIKVNTQNTWIIETPPIGTISWLVDGEPVADQISPTLNYIFQTVGVKNIKAIVSSSTNPNVFGNPCIATTTVTHTGGEIQEQ